MQKIFGAIVGCALICTAHAADLSGVTSVNVTSDTAASAKGLAMARARRQIISDVLGQYANRPQLATAMGNAKNDELTNLVSATSIEGEQQSNTTYSANITMTLDSDAAKRWLDENNVQNWLADRVSDNRFLVNMTLSNPMADWAELKRIARELNTEMLPQNMIGKNVTVAMPVSARSGFTNAVRVAGWHGSDTDDVLRIWK